MQPNLDRQILRQLCKLNDGILAIRPETTTSIHYDWETVCDSNGNSIRVRYGYVSDGTIITPEYYNLDGTIFTGTLGECATSGKYESDAVKFCSNNSTIIRWYVKLDGVPTGDIYDTDLNNNILPFDANATIGECITSFPGIHLIENVGNGTYASPFLANCVTVSYDTTVPGLEEITVELIGSISGNKVFKVYGNNQEQICFDSKVIQGVIISGVTIGFVDIEFKSK